MPIIITSVLKETFHSVNKAFGDARELALKQPIPGKQLVLMTDANIRSAGYALMIEDNLDQKTQSKQKRVPPWHSARKYSPLHNLKCLYTQRNFWQSVWHFLSLHIFCGKQQRQQFP